MALVALALGRRERFARPARIALVAASIAYLLARLITWSAFADLAGRFYA